MRTTSKRSLPLVVVALVSWFSPVRSAEAQTAEQAPRNAGAAAQSALAQGLDLVRTTKDYHLLGLRSAQETRQVVLGSPMRVREIGYDRLLAFEMNADPATVYTGPEQLFYPVLVGGEVRAGITVVAVEGTWRTVGLGDASRAQAIQEAKLGLGAELGRRDSDTGVYALVSVPAFQLLFVEATGDRGTLFRPLSQQVPQELEIDKTLEESEVIARLSEYAKRFDAEYGERIRARELVH